MTVVLLGLRGCGKTTVGRLVAGRLGVEFVDTDALVVVRAGMSIAEIFSRQGQSAFRDIESAVLEDAIRWQGDRVIATGGGIVVRPSNVELLARSGAYRVYLRCDPAELLRRTMSDPSSPAQRPRLSSEPDPMAEIHNLLADREPTFRKLATREIDVTHLSAEQVSAMIRSEIQTDTLCCFGG